MNSTQDQEQKVSNIEQSTEQMRKQQHVREIQEGNPEFKRKKRNVTYERLNELIKKIRTVTKRLDQAKEKTQR